jgi:probable phosphoglycerate mutase
MPTTLLLVRHGQTDANAKQVFQGRMGVGLNDVGRDEARRLGARLRGRGIARIVASDQERAVETATLLRGALEPAPPLELDPALREVDVGAWSGLDYAQVEAKFPDEWAAWLAGRDVRRGGGETYGELGERIHAALARVAESSAGKTTLVVTHGAALRSFTCVVLGLVPPGPKSLGGATNCGLTTVVWEAGSFRLVSWNEPVPAADEGARR